MSEKWLSCCDNFLIANWLLTSIGAPQGLRSGLVSRMGFGSQEQLHLLLKAANVEKQTCEGPSLLLRCTGAPNSEKEEESGSCPCLASAVADAPTKQFFWTVKELHSRLRCSLSRPKLTTRCYSSVVPFLFVSLVTLASLLEPGVDERKRESCS